jgi:integrase
MNGGHRGRKFFSTQADAFIYVGKLTNSHRISAVISRAVRTDRTDKLESLVELFIANETARGLSEDGLKQTRMCLRRFAKTFGHVTPKDVTPEDIDSWLATLSGKKRTIYNFFSQVRQFYNWKEIRKLCPDSPFEFMKSPPKQAVDDRREILTVEEMQKLLLLEVEPWVKVTLVLGAFAGLRPSEISRMGWECIDEEYKEINVNKLQSKGGKAARPRSITLLDAVIRHLPKGEGMFYEGIPKWRWSRLGRGRTKKTTMLQGLTIPPNALRHSFASYHLSHFREAAKTAHELGHAGSPRMLYETYANTVSRRDAAAWWAL